MKRLFFWIFVATALVLVACSGGGGEAQKPAAEPSITSFSGNLSQVVSGGKVVLSWVSVDGVSAVIQPGDIAVDLSGSLEVSLAADTTYTLVVTGAQGKTVSASVSVTVVPPPDPDSEPVITSFSADVSQVVSGGKVVLSWVSVDGVSAVMQPGDVAVDLSGSLEVFPIVSATYTLVVTGVKGDTVSASIPVTIVAAPDPNDPYADQAGKPIPSEIEKPTIIPAMNLSEPDGDGLIEINVSGLLLDAGGMSVQQVGGTLTEDDFTVVEDGMVKGITVRKVGDGGPAVAADIMFVLDTTGSMMVGLASVTSSIEEFMAFLSGSGLNVRVGAITFGDAFDTRHPENPDGTPGVDESFGISLMGEEPPAFDKNEERASLPFTDDYAEFMEYLTYEGREPGREGGDRPENALGALEHAFDTQSFGWRPGAQRHFVVITDECSHTAATYERAGITGPWIPSTFDIVRDKLRGHAQVHVIQPSLIFCHDEKYSRKDYVVMTKFTGVDATGGVHVEWANRNTPFDLTTLPIMTTMSDGYVVTYRGTVDGTSHNVRLVIDDGNGVRGETDTDVIY